MPLEAAVGIGHRPLVQLRLHSSYPELGLLEVGPRCADVHQRPPWYVSLLRTRWGPSPCDRLSRPPTTATPPPPPLGISWRRAFPPVRPRRAQVGPLGGFPRSRLHRSTGEVPNYAPAVSPRLRRSPSPWPPCRRHRPAREFPAPLRCQCAPQPSPDPSGSSWWVP